MKKYITIKTALGVIIGGIAGFAYYYYIGCASGTCPITSNPYISIGYGAVFGILLATNKKKEENKKPAE